MCVSSQCSASSLSTTSPHRAVTSAGMRLCELHIRNVAKKKVTLFPENWHLVSDIAHHWLTLTPTETWAWTDWVRQLTMPTHTHTHALASPALSLGSPHPKTANIPRMLLPHCFLLTPSYIFKGWHKWCPNNLEQTYTSISRDHKSFGHTFARKNGCWYMTVLCSQALPILLSCNKSKVYAYCFQSAKHKQYV